MQTAQVEKPDDLDGAFQRLRDENVQAVIVPANGLLNSMQTKIIEKATALRMPLIFYSRQGVVAGGLASYGINTAENYQRAATCAEGQSIDRPCVQES